MPTATQSPGPVTTSRKPRKKEQDVIAGPEGRAGSAGGIVLETTHAKLKDKEKMSSNAPTKPAATAPSKEANTTSTTGPHRQRRRPRKLNREPASQTPTESATNAPKIQNNAASSAATSELEALKSRVRGLEAKVEELYNSGAADARSGRSPRRRGKKKSVSSQQVPTLSDIGGTTNAEDEEEADEELVRLEGELEDARRDLETYSPRPRRRRTTSDDSEFIEEIPRNEPGVEDTVTSGDRQVTLTGSYRIPLPSSVSMKDVKSIQSGVTAAQNVAKSFLEQRRASQAVQNQSQSKAPSSAPNAKAKAKQSSKVREDSSSVVKSDDGKQTWSEWFGGYSVAISRAVQNIEAEAAVEAQKANKPPRPSRTTSTASSKPAKSAPKSSTASTSKGGARPPLKQRTGNLSSEQVQGLMG
ncbi:hypothetical protein BU24DRAFT_426526 [Aaosphaeria arxii CBS 175.79]|uniref:Uncharacterized protein n=1 Tax=Aaosphaeria arxii CBS 175.79 TaxID=1450172 RepID=A0A6A5XEF4_9PLEO|nr:uncharacterized protein BU24DRAFT_426526 [Aaosphaeria arxii CBS 175.79]KAF2011442.1 hypothetical protein BU24DRAFT_426526 [Aaosphaeria arxii CBS 175.79]